MITFIRFLIALSILFLFPHIKRFSLPSLLLALLPEPPNSFYRAPHAALEEMPNRQECFAPLSGSLIDRTIKFYLGNFCQGAFEPRAEYVFPLPMHLSNNINTYHCYAVHIKILTRQTSPPN